MNEIIAKIKERIKKNKELKHDYYAKSYLAKENVKYNIVEEIGVTNVFIQGLMTLIFTFTNAGVALINLLTPLGFCIASASLSLLISSSFILFTHKHSKLKKRFNLFSKAKTENEKLEEEMYYELEKEKLKYRNQILENTLENMNSLLTIEDFYKSENQNNFYIADSYQKLDEEITKDYINTKYKEINNEDNVLKLSIYPVLESTLFTALIFAPLFRITELPLSVIPHGGAVFIGSMIILTSGILNHNLNLIKAKNKALNNLMAKNNLNEKKLNCFSLADELMDELTLLETKKYISEMPIEIKERIKKYSRTIYEPTLSFELNKGSRKRTLYKDR